MPVESLIKVKLDLSKLRVFGCDAYVFLPKEVRANKLTPKSELMTYIGYETGVKRWRFMWQSGAIFTGAMATFDKTLFPCCPGAKTLERTDLSETLDLEGHIPHWMPDGGLTPPGPPFENLSQDDSHDNHGNEGPDYPGNLDDKSSESSPPSIRLPSWSTTPPPWYLKKAGLPHLSEVRHDMEEWNQLPRRSGHERNTTRHPGNMYGKTHPPSEIERNLMCDWYWKKIVGLEALSGSQVQPPHIPPSSQALDSDTEENDQHNITPPEDIEHPEISKQEAHKGGNMLIAKLLALAVPTSDS